MNKTDKKLSIRWAYMTIGVVAMLFAGVLYAWSILKSPLSAEFGWGQSDLALNFTLAMTFFCIGGLLGSQMSKRFGHRIALISAGVLSAAGAEPPPYDLLRGVAVFLRRLSQIIDISPRPLLREYGLRDIFHFRPYYPSSYISAPLL